MTKPRPHTIGIGGDIVPQPPGSFGDIRDVLLALPHGDPHGGTQYVHSDIFPVRHELIRALDPAPRSVFEFGALYGYFLVTALDAAPSIRSVGWVDNEQHTIGSNEMCKANVLSVRPGIGYGYARSHDTMLEVYHDGYDVHVWPGRRDLVAVDSDHTYAGALADLRAAHALNPMTIMVDDWTAGTHGDDIHEAVAMFLCETATNPGEYPPIDVYTIAEYQTVNGLAVLTRRDWTP